MENQAAAIDPRAAVKRAVFLIILFVLVITGAFAIKVGVEDGYLSKIKSFMRSGIGLNLPPTAQENISPADINVDKLLPADSLTIIGQNSDTSANKPREEPEITPAQPKSASKPTTITPKSPATSLKALNLAQTPQTLEAQVAGLSKQIEAISSEVKKMEALNEIQSQISVISVKVNEITKNVSELKSQSSLTDLQSATSKVNMGTSALNSTIALNPAGK